MSRNMSRDSETVSLCREGVHVEGSIHVIAISITLSLFGSFVPYLAKLFGSFIWCFDPSRNLYFYAGDTHFYSHLKSDLLGQLSQKTTK